MPDEKRADPVNDFLSEMRSLDDRRAELIKDLLRQKEAAIRSYDDKLALLGHQNTDRLKRNHHKPKGDKKGTRRAPVTPDT